ncbi:MAG TPA: hypothetical protein VFX01_00945 [Methylophilaceae bacterium]|nr:hypothetical protein [Methylophilaceae bacterium]
MKLLELTVGVSDVDIAQRIQSLISGRDRSHTSKPFPCPRRITRTDADRLSRHLAPWRQPYSLQQRHTLGDYS